MLSSILAIDAGINALKTTMSCLMSDGSCVMYIVVDSNFYSVVLEN